MDRRRALKLLLGTIVAVVLAEFVLRVPLADDSLATRDEAFWAEHAAMQSALYMADPELVYVPRPGATHGDERFDEWGRRAQDRVDGGWQIAMVGDSLVWGELVSSSEWLPAQLQQELGVPVWNFGVTGYDLSQTAGWTSRAVLPRGPDVVVVVFCLNDLMTMSLPFHEHATPAQLSAYRTERAEMDKTARIRNETLQQLYWVELQTEWAVWAHVRHFWRWHRLNTFGGYTDEYLISTATPKRSTRGVEALDRLGSAISEAGAEPVLVIAPATYWWHDYKWDSIHSWARQNGERAGFTVLDPLPDWQAAGHDPAAWRFEGDNLHYNAAGNAAFGAWLAKELPEAPGLSGRD